MKHLFIASIIFVSSVYGMNGPYADNELSGKNVAHETIRMSSISHLSDRQSIELANEDDFSDTSSSTVEIDNLLPLSNANINDLIRQEISPDVYGITTLKVDFAGINKAFTNKQDIKSWKPPIIPFGRCSETSEAQEETDNDGPLFEFAF